MTQHPIPDAALDADIAILGKKGKGKSYTAKSIVERLLTMGRRVLVIDAMGHWWGLRTGADGKKPGFRIAVFGGEHGDMPLTEAMARPLARILGRENLPAVLDIGQMRKAQMVRFVAELLDELYATNRDPLWLVIEEADLFAPQNPLGDTVNVLAEVDRIARRGRAYGFRLITMTQRPARLHKDVLTQLSTLVALGMSAPQDREAIEAWVKGNADAGAAKEVLGSLAGLDTGEAWVWAPELDLLKRVRMPAITTLDTSATPKAGEKRIEPKRLADVDVSAIRAALEQPKAEETATDRKAIDESREEAERTAFERGLRAGREEKEKALAAAEAAHRQHIAAIQDAGEDLADLARTEIARVRAVLGQLAEAVAAEAARCTWALEALGATGAPAPATPPGPAHSLQPKPPPRAERPMPPKPASAPVPRQSAPVPPAVFDLPPARQRILVALRKLEAIGHYPASKTQLALVAGASHRSSTFKNNLGGLSTGGLIRYPGPGLVELTEAGAERVPQQPRPGHADMVAMARELLTPAQFRLLEVAIDNYPGSLTTDALASLAGVSVTSSSFKNNRGRLSSLGLITYPEPGTISAADCLFP